MKKIIISGIPRSGKSTLCRKCLKVKTFTYIPFDTIVSTMENLFPETGISHQQPAVESSRHNALFLKEYLKHLEYENQDFLLDIYPLWPEHWKKMERKNYTTIWIGYPMIDVDEKLITIRKNARPGDWTEELNDVELKHIVEAYIEESKEIQKQCHDLNLPFIDSGRNYYGSLEKAMDLILN